MSFNPQDLKVGDVLRFENVTRRVLAIVGELLCLSELATDGELPTVSPHLVFKKDFIPTVGQICNGRWIIEEKKP